MNDDLSDFDEEDSASQWDAMTDDELLNFNWQGRQEGDGLCLVAAFQWAMRHPEVTLVHSLLNGGKLHAFCVHDDSVFDLTLGPTKYVQNKDDYIKSLKPSKMKCYSYDQTVKISFARGFYEFWDFPDQKQNES